MTGVLRSLGSPPRRRARLTSGVALLVAAAVLALAGASQAQSTEDEALAGGTVEGFTLTSRAHAVRVTFDTPGALPIGPLLELTAPESRAGLSTGDTGTAFSSIGHPGPVLSGLPQILATTGAPIPGLPPYPFAAEASTSGPNEVFDATSLPGSTMKATARDGRVEADTRAPALDVPTVLELGTLRSTATAVHEGGVRASSSTEAGAVDLLGGLVHVDAVRSTAVATSDGGTPTADASTTVVGASFLGTPVTITPDGVELAGSGARHDLVSLLLAPLGGPDGLLAQTGLRIRAGAVVERTTADSAVVGAEGLTIEVNGRIDVSALASVLAVLGPLPSLPGSPVQPGDLLGILGSNQVRSLSVGQATAELTARGPVAVPDGGGAVPDLTGGDALPSLPVGELPSFGPTGAPVAAPTGGGSPTGTGGFPTSTSLPALPASGALAAIGGGLVLSAGLRRFADLALDPVAAGAACPLQPDGGPTND